MKARTTIRAFHYLPAKVFGTEMRHMYSDPDSVNHTVFQTIPLLKKMPGYGNGILTPQETQ